MSEYSADFSSEVFGGSGVSIFFLLNGPQLISNSSFENNDDGWNEYGTSVISRVSNADAPFGDYALKIADNAAGGEEYAYTDQIEPYNGDTIENKVFLCSFWSKCDTDGTVTVQAYSNDSDTSLKNVDSKNCALEAGIWQQFYFLFAMQNEADATEFHLRFHPYRWIHTEDGSSTGTVYIDQVRLWKVGYIIQMPHSYNMKQRFVDDETASYRLAFGYQKRYVDGKRYEASMQWQILTPSQEMMKSAIMGSTEFFFVPHSDYDWGVLCFPDGPDERMYLAGKYIGHQASISFKGLETLPMKAAQLMETNYYTEWDENFVSTFLGDNLPWNAYIL